jgi:hypothetical protein
MFSGKRFEGLDVGMGFLISMGRRDPGANPVAGGEVARLFGATSVLKYKFNGADILSLWNVGRT